MRLLQPRNTVRESGARPGYEATGFAGIGVPRNTPAAIVDLLNRELNAAIADPGVRARILDLGGTPVGGTAAEFEAILAAAIEKWGRVIKFAGISVD
jgi:tripartite-type tricarboxylate transporter receptor subunit TctC